jgi:ElaB/YqjD/DUF883 family membrane-anchored ribosome-binding protein
MMTTELTVNNGNVTQMKDKLVEDLKAVVGDADNLMREVASLTSDEFAATRLKIEEKLAETRSRLNDARISVSRKACCVADSTNEYVKDNPCKVLAVAAAVGLIVGAIVSRR